MVNKKRRKIPTTTIELAKKIVIIMFIGFFIIILIHYLVYNQEEKFNPETDVCLKEEKICDTGRLDYVEKYYRGNNVYVCGITTCGWSGDGINTYHIFACNYTDIKPKWKPESLTDTSKCIEFRPKTQCELGNQSWKEDIKIICSTIGYIANYPYYLNTYKAEFIRKVYDGSCERLYVQPKDIIPIYKNLKDDEPKQEYKIIESYTTTKNICREKTQQELNEDYCNKNPNDNERCDCIENKEVWKKFLLRTTTFEETFIQYFPNNITYILEYYNGYFCGEKPIIVDARPYYNITFEKPTCFKYLDKETLITTNPNEKPERYRYYDYISKSDKESFIGVIYEGQEYYWATNFFEKQNQCLKAIPK